MLSSKRLYSTSTSSYSSNILPTNSSKISSIVSKPAVPPYSSTTIAICILFACNSSKISSIGFDSGTKYASLMISAILNSFLVLTSFNISFKNRIPFISSIVSSYTGILLYLYSSISSKIPYISSFISIAYMSVL